MGGGSVIGNLVGGVSQRDMWGSGKDNSCVGGELSCIYYVYYIKK